MGSSAAGNFASDAARRRVAEIVRDLAERIPDALNHISIDDGFDELMASLEVIRLLCAGSAVPAPRPADILDWRTAALGIFDQQIDGLDLDPGFKTERRAVIARTFDDLLSLAKRSGRK